MNSIPRHLRDHLQPLLRSALSLAFASATVSHSMLEMSSEAPPQTNAFCTQLHIRVCHSVAALAQELRFGSRVVE